MDFTDLRQLILQAARDDVPALLGRVAECEALCRLRLAEQPTQPTSQRAQIIDAIRAAEIANTTAKWLLERTRRLPFRRDLSRKKPRFDEEGLRRWLSERKR